MIMTSSTPWYQKAFQEHYLQVYAHRSLAQAWEEVQTFLPFIPPLDAQTPVLDLCCGAGRHLQAIQAYGTFPLFGLDLSWALLREAQQIVPSIPVIQGDMRQLPFLPETFQAIFQFFTSFGYFSDSENADFLRQIANLLKPQGFYVLDYLNPIQVRATLIPYSTTVKNAYTLQETRTIRENRVEKEVTLSFPEQQIQYQESVRLYLKEELEILFHQAGFTDLQFFGNFRGERYESQSPRLIILARKGIPLCN